MIELPADHPGTVERIIIYLYLGDYRQTGHLISMATAEEDGPSHVGLNHADVYVTADKYDIQPLKNLAAKKMTSWAKSNFKNPGFIDVARHILQIKHDPWPYEFVSRCIRENMRSLTLDDAQIFKLIGDFGRLGETVLMGIVESKMLRSPRLEAENAREKTLLEEEVASLKQQLLARTVTTDINAKMRNKIWTASGDAASSTRERNLQSVKTALLRGLLVDWIMVKCGTQPVTVVIIRSKGHSQSEQNSLDRNFDMYPNRALLAPHKLTLLV